MRVRPNIPALILSALLAAALAGPAAAQSMHDDLASAATLDIESPIIVTGRSTDDDTITGNVVDVLANDSRLAGRIGVQTTDREVELTGIVTSPSQRLQAERDAKSVYGVRNVHNLLSTRIGAGRF